MRNNLQHSTTLILLLTSLFIVPAAVACPNPSASAAAQLNALRLSGMLRPTPSQGIAEQGATSKNGDISPAIVGMWEVTLFAGGKIYDHAFQQLHADGLEMQNSGIVPPVFDNICWGVWRQTSARTFQLKHFGWTFDADGNNTGTFILTAKIKVSASGSRYMGTYVADVILPSGQADPGQHVSGAISGQRLTLD